MWAMPDDLAGAIQVGRQDPVVLDPDGGGA
jgi:hypothetical protein